ncbi:unnamed protein product, partial [Rotaria sp. Silwood2]
KKKETPVISPSSSSISNSLNSQQKISIVAEATSSTSIENKHIDKNEDDSGQQEIYQSDVYSFEKFNNDLVNNSRTFISQHGFDPILIQLFENICIIDGYVRSIIHPLNQQIEHLIQNLQLHNQSEIEFYSKNLIEIYTICRSVKTLIKLNKKNFNHIEQFLIIINSFSKFYKNLKVFICFK